MAEAIVSRTVEMLRDLLLKEGSFLSGVKNEVQEMQDELQRMQCFLKDADNRQYEDESVRNWVRSIRNLAYKIENVLEAYAIKVESRKGNGIRKTLKRYACLLDEGVNLHKLGVEIGKIRNQIASLTRSLQTYGIKLENIGESSNAASKNLLRQTFSHEVEEHFVGMEDDVCRLVSLLTDRDNDGRIISIFGMGGSGKTTIAKQVFNHVHVQHHFESFAWVVVSQQFNADHLLKEILSQLRKDKYDIDRMEYRQLIKEISKAQREKKCLVVIDDIWKTEHWEIIRPAFPSTSKVLLTTRIRDVAQIGILHELNLFSADEGWQLLKRKALTSASAREHEKEYESMGKRIVHKCGYLPLAISVIGGILSKKDTLQEWEMLNKDIDLYLSFGEGIESNHQLMCILSLSYQDLPYQLKPCFMYLACYPEDARIAVEGFYCLWIAEGMVQSKDQRGDETLMDVAERYLTELVSRSLVQIQLDDQLQGARGHKSCHLHDLMRDLCLMKCKEEDFVNVMEFKDTRQVSVLNSLGRNASYRLFIYGEADDNVYKKILQEVNEGTRAYSLRNLEHPLIACRGLKYLTNLQFVRTLLFEGVEFSDQKLLHKVIKHLIHLRFLSFYNCKLDEVPSSIAMLPYLQIFHLSVGSGGGDIKIPNVFWKIKTLMHLFLYMNGNSSTQKLRLDCLSGLESLHVDLCPTQAKDLSNLTNLRHFKTDIWDNEYLSLIISCIDQQNWSKVREIRLFIKGDCDLVSTDGRILLQKLFISHAVQILFISDVLIKELPKFESTMLASSDLVFLTLEQSFISEDPMPILEKLPKLKDLWLYKNSFLGEELICSSTGFPNLRNLVLQNLPNLNRWRIDEGAMPNLYKVSIEGCWRLEMIPNGVKFLKVLRNLETIKMFREFNNRIRIINGQEGADFDKVCHVPRISISDEIDLSELRDPQVDGEDY